MAGSLLEVGELAERAGVCVQTLHYYERLGLLPKPDRSASNYRLYSAEALRRVQFIKKAQGLGFTLVEVKEILDLHDHGRAPCRQVADGNIAVLKVKIPSMDCAACAASIQAKLRKQMGVVTAQVSLERKQAVVTYNAKKVKTDALIAAVNKAGGSRHTFKAEEVTEPTK